MSNQNQAGAFNDQLLGWVAGVVGYRAIATAVPSAQGGHFGYYVDDVFYYHVIGMPAKLDAFIECDLCHAFFDGQVCYQQDLKPLRDAFDQHTCQARLATEAMKHVTDLKIAPPAAPGAV